MKTRKDVNILDLLCIVGTFISSIFLIAFIIYKCKFIGVFLLILFFTWSVIRFLTLNLIELYKLKWKIK